MKKDVKIVTATVMLVLIMGVFKPMISWIVPSLNGELAELLRKILQAATVVAFISVLRLWKNVGVIPKVSKTSVLLLLPVFILSFIPIINGFSVGNGLQIFIALITSALIGIIEELEFRGVIFGALKARGKETAILVSSILFGLAHLLNLFYGAGIEETILQVIFAFGFGLTVAVVRYKTDLILPQMIVHALWDFNFEIANTNFNHTMNVIHSIAIGLVILWGAILVFRIFKSKEDNEATKAQTS